MIIKSVKLANFRCHDLYGLKCDDNTSLILGENGCGKTSVLEAIYIALRGKSFRAVDRDILKRKKEFYRVELEYFDGEKVVVAYDGKDKTFITEDKKFKRLPKKNRYPVVLFLPDDLNLVSSSPVHKRDYFDGWFAQLSDNFYNSLSRYNKALKQRNELLKKEVLKPDELFSWNILMARYGCAINKFSNEVVDRINEQIIEVYRSIAENGDVVKIKYVSQVSVADESLYLKNLEANFEKDRILGYTSFGVHRDNYGFEFNAADADGSASRGEMRTIVLALKFIEARMITETLGKKPVILLDDVFSELDETRQKSLVNNFKDNQVIITSVK